MDRKLSEFDRKDLETKVNQASTAITSGTKPEQQAALAFLRQSGRQWVHDYTFSPPQLTRG